MLVTGYGLRVASCGLRVAVWWRLWSVVAKEPAEVGVREVFQESTEPPPFKPARKEFYSEPRPLDGLGKQNYLIITLEGKSEIRIRY